MPAKTKTRHGNLTLHRIYNWPELDGGDISLVAWSPDGTLLTYVLSRGDAIQLIAVDADTLERRVLFDWAEILDPAAARRSGLPWDPSDENLPQRIRTFKAEHALSMYYAWSPSGNVMMLGPSIDGPFYLFDVATQTLLPQLAIDPAACDINFSPDGRWITYVLNYNIFLLDTTNGQSIPLTHHGTEVCRNATPDTMGDFIAQGYWWSPDSSRLACLVTDEVLVPWYNQQIVTSPMGALDPERYPQPGDRNPHMHLCVHTSQTETWIGAGPPGYYLAGVQWLDDSRHLALQFLSREQNHLILALADAETGQWSPVLEERSSDWINLSEDLTFLAGGTMFLWSSERDSNRHLYLYSIDGCQLAQLTSGDMPSVEVTAVDEKNGAVYFRGYPAPYIDSQLFRVTYRLEDGRVRVGPVETLTSGAGAHGAILSPDCRYFAEHFSTVTSPPALSLYNRDGKLLKALEGNGVKGLAGEVRPVEFPPLLAAAKIGTPSDDMLLCHRIIRPPNMKGGQRYPAIIYVYGGPVPGGSGRTVVNKWAPVPDLWAQVMAHQGFVMYSLDNRGSCEAPRGHRFESAIRYQLGAVELADQLEGVKYLKSLPFVDPERVGVFGGSFGGFMALTCLLRAPDDFKAGVAFAPVTDWKCYDAIYTERYMGQPDTNVEGYQTTMLPPSAGKLSAKVLLLHGTADQNVHLNHTFNLIEMLVAAGKDVDLMMYPGMDHADFFRLSPQGLQLFERITRFFVAHL